MKGDKNNPASLALVELRKALGEISQQDFAVNYLNNAAVTTVSRYESGNPPPRGEALLRLRSIAMEHEHRQNEELKKAGGDTEYGNKFRHIRIAFENAWVQEIHQAIGSADIGTFVWGPDKTGLLVATLKGAEAFPGALAFLHILQQLKSEEPKFRKNAVDALAKLREADRRFDPPGSHEIDDSFVRMITPSGPAPRKRGRPPKGSQGGKAR